MNEFVWASEDPPETPFGDLPVGAFFAAHPWADDEAFVKRRSRE